MDFIAHLKTVTTSLHRQLEASPVSQQLMSVGVRQKDYINYLVASYHLHCPVEHSVFPAMEEAIPDIKQRYKTGAIKDDLHQQGVAVHHLSFEPLNMDNKEENFYWGMLYVTEGSTLGGKYILKTLQASMGTSVPSSFLDIYGGDTGMRWKNFLKHLDNLVLSASASGREEVVEGAMFAFNRAIPIFNKVYTENDFERYCQS